MTIGYEDLLPEGASSLGGYGDLVPAKAPQALAREVRKLAAAPVIPAGGGEPPSPREIDAATLPARMVMGRGGRAIPAVEVPVGAPLGPGQVSAPTMGPPAPVADTVDVLKSLPDQFHLGNQGTIAQTARMFAQDAANQFGDTVALAKPGEPVGPGYRVPASTIARVAKQAADAQRSANIAEMAGSGIKRDIADATVPFMSEPQQALVSAVQSALPTAAGLALGAAGAAPLGALVASLGGGTAAAANTYDQAVEAYLKQGKPPREAQDLASRDAGINALLEGGGETLPFGLGNYSRSFLMRAGKRSLTEVLQEGGTSLGQDLAAFMSYNPDMTMEQAWKNMRISMMASGMGAGGPSIINAAANSPQRMIAREIEGTNLQKPSDNQIAAAFRAGVAPRAAAVPQDRMSEILDGSAGEPPMGTETRRSPLAPNEQTDVQRELEQEQGDLAREQDITDGRDELARWYEGGDEALAPLEMQGARKYAPAIESMAAKDGKIVGVTSETTAKEVEALGKKLERMARSGIEGKDWYERSGQEISDWAGNDLVLVDKVAQMIAITSDGNSVKGQWTMMLNGLEQFQRGEPIHVGKAAVDRHLNDLLYFGKPWDGRKTNTFYQNIVDAAHSYIHGRTIDSGKSTIDRHMHRIGGDVLSGKVEEGGSAAPTARGYDVMETLTSAVADHMGLLPRQAQAAAWVAQKRDSLLEQWKARGIHKSLTPQQRRAKATEHALVDYKTTMMERPLPKLEELKVPDDQKMAGTVAIPVETVPSASTDQGRAVLGLPLSKRIKYDSIVGRALRGGDLSSGTTDAVADLLGLKANEITYSEGRGSFEGNVNGNVMYRLAPTVPIATVERFVAAMQYVKTQDGIGYFRADPKLIDSPDATQGFRIPVEAPLTNTKLQTMLADLNKIHPDLNFTVLDTGDIAVANWTTLTPMEFSSKVLEFVGANAEKYGFKKSEVTHYGAEGNYSGHDWKEDPSGSRLREQASAGLGPDIPARLDDLRARAISAGEKALDELSPGWRGEAPLEAQGVAKPEGWGDLSPPPLPLADVSADTFFPGDGPVTFYRLGWAKEVGEPIEGKFAGSSERVAQHWSDSDERGIMTGDTLFKYEFPKRDWAVTTFVKGGRIVQPTVENLQQKLPASAKLVATVPFDDNLFYNNGESGAAIERFFGGPMLAQGVSKVDLKDIKNPVSGTPEQKLDQLERLTAENKPILDRMIAKITADLGVEGNSNVKQRDRIAEKAARPSVREKKPWHDIEHIRDSLRFKLVVDSPKQYPAVAKALRDAGISVVKIDTSKLLEPGMWGWRIVSTDLRMPNGQLVEGYFPVKELEGAKGAKGHHLFEQWRNQKVGEMTSQQWTKMLLDINESIGLYEAAWRENQRRTGVDDSAALASLKSMEASFPDAIEKSLSSPTLSPSGISDQLPSTRMAKNGGAPTTTVPLSGEMNAAGSMGGSISPVTFQGLGLKTARAQEIGFRARNEINGIQPLTEERQGKVAEAIALAVKRGLPQALVPQLTVVEYHPTFSGNQMVYWTANKTIGVSTSTFDNESVSGLADMIVHEMAHAIDDVSRGREDQGNYISRNSPRLAVIRAEDGRLSAPEGADLMAEILDAASMLRDRPILELAIHFGYPMAPLQLGHMDVKWAGVEMFAQAASLYNRSPDLVRKHLPKWAAVLEKIYGDPNNASKASAVSIEQARDILRQELQDQGSLESVSQGVSGARGLAATGVKAGSGNTRGPPGAGVGAGAGSGAPSGPGGPASRGQGPAGVAQWDVLEPGLIDSITRDIQNNKIDLHRVQDAIEKAAGTMPAPDSPRLAEELFKGRVRARVLKAHRNEITPLLKAISESSVTVDQLGEYLWARHTPERNAQMAVTNGIPNSAGNNLAGQTNAEAAAKLAAFTPEQKRDLASLAAQVRAITDATQAIIVNEGLESQTTIDAWNRVYKEYVPLFRDVDGPTSGAGSFQVTGPESKRAKGSDKAAIAIVAAVIAQHEKAIMRAEKNKVGLALLKMATDNPHPDFWRVGAAPLVKTFDPTTGLEGWQVDRNWAGYDNTFVVKVKDPKTGEIKQRGITFNKNSERAMALSRGMQGLDVVQLDGVTKAIGNVTRIMANLATQWNPQFWVTNFARDVQTAGINIQATELKGQMPKIYANIPRAIAGILSAEFKDGTGKWAQLYRDFEDSGAKMGWATFFDDLVERNKEIEREISASQRGNANPLKWASIAIDVIGKVNSAIENGTRLSIYAAARDAGLHDMKSASIAKNATVNFDRKGNRSSAIGAWFMFFNAQFQGTTILLKSIASSHRVQAYVGVMTAFAAAMELVNRMIGGDDRDDDGNNAYELIPEHVKQRNMIFMLPKTGNGEAVVSNGNVIGRYVSIPLPYGFSIFHNAGRLSMEAALGSSDLVDKKKKPLDFAASFADSLLDNFGPLGGSSTGLQYFAPTVAKPFVQSLENKTWYGSPIVPEALPNAKPKPKADQYFRSNSDTSKELAKWLSEISGGDDIKGGALDVHPGTLDHIFGTVAGGTGRFGLGMFDFAKNTIAKINGDENVPDMPVRNIPFVGKFFGEVDERDIASRYYELSRDAKKAYSEYKEYRKAGEMDKAYAIEDKNPELIQMGKEIDKKSMRSELKRVRKELDETKDLPRQERAKARQDIRREEAGIMGAALRAYNDSIREQRGSE